MAIRCASCEREVAGTPEPGTPCPTCVVRLVPDAPLEVDPVWAAARPPTAMMLARRLDSAYGTMVVISTKLSISKSALMTCTNL